MPRESEIENSAHTFNHSRRYVGISAVVLFLCLGGFCLWNLFSPSPLDLAYDNFLIGSGIAGCGFGLVWFFARSALPKPTQSVPPSKRVGAVILATGIGLALLTVFCGLRQFGGFDHSVLVDIGWRMTNGQIPYRDFPCTLPLGFYLGAYYAFKLFGPFWQSIVIFHALFTALFFYWSYALLKNLLSDRAQAFFLALSCQAISMVLVAYWWYNPITSMAGVVFLLSAGVILRLPLNRLAGASYFLSLLLLATMKPNVAGPLIVLVTSLLVSVRQPRIFVIIASGAAFVCFCGVLVFHKLSLSQLLNSYLAISDRGFSSRMFQDASANEIDFVKTILLLLFIPLFSRDGLGKLKTWDRFHWILVVGVIVAFYGLLTNGEVKLVDAPLLLVATCLYSCPQNSESFPSKQTTFWIRYCGSIAIFLACVGIAESLARHRVKAIGYGNFFEYIATNSPEDGFFKHCSHGQRLAAVQREVPEVISAVARHLNRPEKELRICFGPRMQWAYAANHLQSPKYLPVWWHPGVAFDRKDEAKYEQAWLNEPFDVMIFLRGDATYLSGNFLSQIMTHYDLDKSYPHLSVLLPKTPPNSPEPTD